MNRKPRPAWRKIDGIVLLDKPQGLTSNKALQKVRELLRAEKGGHTGALDPLATGLLPICLGEATKIAGILLGSDKAYRTRVQLGVETDTDDSEGLPIREASVPELTPSDIEAALAGFCGTIEQIPPRYSAIKRDGEPLYRLVRRGEVVELAPRTVHVHRIDLVAHGPGWLELDVECGSGTYIRSLARDLGQVFGCGGHVSVLRRLWVDPFRGAAMHTLESLAERVNADGSLSSDILLPIEAGLTHWRRVELDAAQSVQLRHGQRIATNAMPGEVLAVDARGLALGLADVDAQGMVLPRRLFIRAEGEASTKIAN